MNLKTLGLAAFLMGSVAAIAPAAAETMTVDQNGADVVQVDGNVTSIIVGNPMIAEVSVLDGGVLVVHGRLFGTTRILALDDAGTALADLTVTVTAPTGEQVALFRGPRQRTYSCPDNCYATFQPGDDPEHADLVSNQDQQLQGLSDWALEQTAQGQ